MVKCFGLLFIVSACFLTGVYFSLRLKFRFEFLSSFRGFMSNLETNIRYDSRDIFELIKASAPDYISGIFGDERGELSSYWKNTIKNIPPRYSLKNEDLSLFTEFGRMLGTTDIEGQLNHISLYKELIETNIDNSKKELNSKSRLYKLLGLFAGIAAALLLI